MDHLLAPDHNRYTDIVPFRRTSVKVDDENNAEPSRWYVNASYIMTPYLEGKRIIAAQGPLGNTISNFWKMVKQNKVALVIMLCDLKEQGSVKCANYWDVRETTATEESLREMPSKVKTKKLSPGLLQRWLTLPQDDESKEGENKVESR